MNLEQQYDAIVRNYAEQLVNENEISDERIYPDTRFLVEMSTRYEKTVINRMRKKLNREIQELERHGIGFPLKELEMSLEIIEARWEVIND